MSIDETRFGATWANPHTASAVVKAHAARIYGRPVTQDVVLSAAAVIAAEAWAYACHASSLTQPGQHGADAEMAILGVFRALTGLPEDHSGNIEERLSLTHLAFAEELAGRVEDWDLPVHDVLLSAATMLARGDAHRRIAQVVAALEAVAVSAG